MSEFSEPSTDTEMLSDDTAASATRTPCRKQTDEKRIASLMYNALVQYRRHQKKEREYEYCLFLNKLAIIFVVMLGVMFAVMLVISGLSWVLVEDVAAEIPAFALFICSILITLLTSVQWYWIELELARYTRGMRVWTEFMTMKKFDTYKDAKAFYRQTSLNHYLSRESKDESHTW